jgi:hypothetical protein
MRTIIKVKANPNLSLGHLIKLVRFVCAFNDPGLSPEQIEKAADLVMGSLTKGLEDLEKMETMNSNKELFQFIKDLDENEEGAMDALGEIFALKKDIVR